MRAIKTFEFKNNTLLSKGELNYFPNHEMSLNNNKHKDIEVATKNMLETKLGKENKQLSGYAGLMFSLYHHELNGIWVVWHIFNWEEAEEAGLTKETVFSLMGMELKNELEELIKSL